MSRIFVSDDFSRDGHNDVISALLPVGTELVPAADLAAAQQEIARLRAALADVVHAYRNPHNAALDVNAAINRAAQEI